METKIIKNITDFLGREDERYFSNGFKFIDFEYKNLNYCDKLFVGEIYVNYNWTKKSSRHAHLGTVEYVAISSVICEQMLLSEFHLTSEQIAHSWISDFKTKIIKYRVVWKYNDSGFRTIDFNHQR